MSAKKSSVKKNNGEKNGVRTWIELDAEACRHNVKTFRRLIGAKVELWAVVKSNAYGHGLPVFPKLIEPMGVDGFCVDSIPEGLRLRNEGIRKPILVLGFTLPALFEKAALHDIAVTISSFDSLRAMSKIKRKPFFHLKIDTGMHRQGFQEEEMPKLVAALKQYRLVPEGVYSHYAFPENTRNSRMQRETFERCIRQLACAGIRPKRLHMSGTGGVWERRDRYPMVRIGLGIYGYLRRPVRRNPLRPVMTWKTVVSEIKQVKKGERIGYDFIERFQRDSAIAILPIGYWHGFDRGFSSIGEVLIRGKRAKVMGRVSMDMIAVDVTDIRGVQIGDEAILIGLQGREFIGADKIAKKIDTEAYEMLTRVNPLIQKIVV